MIKILHFVTMSISLYFKMLLVISVINVRNKTYTGKENIISRDSDSIDSLKIEKEDFY